jgi:hypothetical protein
MKKFLSILAFVAVFGFVTLPANANLGVIYENSITPGNGYINAGTARYGEVTCTSYFSLVGLGDCSVKAAMRAGKISSLSYYDVVTKNILGYRKITVRAYGN